MIGFDRSGDHEHVTFSRDTVSRLLQDHGDAVSDEPLRNIGVGHVTAGTLGAATSNDSRQTGHPTTADADEVQMLVTQFKCHLI
jgi:hypothetical protein